MGFRNETSTVLVEYDGDEHYRSSLKIKADREKDEAAASHAYSVVRIPYWVQLDSVTIHHFFGIKAEIDQNFPHGFVTTKLFPASFCELGVKRFESELSALPSTVRTKVIDSLRDRVMEYGLEYVLPTNLGHLVA